MTPSRRFATVLAAAAALTLPLLVLPTSPALSFSGGAPPGFAGPEQYCNYCHGGIEANPVNSGTGSVEITAPDTFAPGDTLSITVTVHSTTEPTGPTTKQGFELAARDADLNYVGSFIVDGTTVQFSPGTPDPYWVTHTPASNTDSTWTFEWVAPATETPGSVTLYAAGNAANGGGFPDDGDKIYATTHVLALATPNEPGAAPLAFRLAAPYPNPLPAGAAATVRYELDRPATVTALVRDGRGRVVRVLEQGPRPGGAHTLRLPATGLAAGTYFLTLSTPEGTQVQLFTVVR